jgi:pre-mRNA-splicing factor RBM22/SLT11
LFFLSQFLLWLCFSRDNFYQHGEIRSVTVVPKQSCAFVQFTQRDAAERAAKETFNKLVIDGKRLTVKWGKPPSAQAISGRLGEAGGFESSFEPVPGLPTGKKQMKYFIKIRFYYF